MGKGNFKKFLPVELEEVQILDRSRTLSQRIIEKQKVETEKKSVVAEYGENLKELNADISRLSEVIATGKERQNVDCTYTVDIENKRIRTQRLDTEEIFESRLMSELEIEQYKQGELF